MESSTSIGSIRTVRGRQTLVIQEYGERSLDTLIRILSANDSLEGLVVRYDEIRNRTCDDLGRVMGAIKGHPNLVKIRLPLRWVPTEFMQGMFSHFSNSLTWKSLDLGFILSKSNLASRVRLELFRSSDTIPMEVLEEIAKIPNLTHLRGGRDIIPVFDKLKDDPMCKVSKLTLLTSPCTQDLERFSRYTKLTELIVYIERPEQLHSLFPSSQLEQVTLTIRCKISGRLRISAS